MTKRFRKKLRLQGQNLFSEDNKYNICFCSTFHQAQGRQRTETEKTLHSSGKEYNFEYTVFTDLKINLYGLKTSFLFLPQITNKQTNKQRL